MCMVSPPAALLLLALGAALLPADKPATNLLPNPDLKEWKEGAPAGWKLEVGATSGTEKESEVAAGPEGGVLLRGDGETGRWRMLTAPFRAEAGACYRLDFEHRAADLRCEGSQFDNAYVALALPSGRERPDLRLHVLLDGKWRPGMVVGRAAAAGEGFVRIFLSKSGAMEVRNPVLTVVPPEGSFDLLVADMALHYSHFASKKVDWYREAAPFRAKAEAAKDSAAFAKAILPLLGKLEDIHVSVRLPGGAVLPGWRRSFKGNADFSAVRKALADPASLDDLGLAGVAGKDLGYLAVSSLPGDRAAAAPLFDALEGMLDRRGILLDLRFNNGGDEGTAAAIAGYFAREPVVYARSRYRDGPGFPDFGPAYDRVLRPREGRRFEGPVVCLVGPGCVSSGEGLAQMMAAVEGVVLVGQPTGGCSGNPWPVELPNGVVVHYSRWIDLMPDGSPLEGRGVVPDVVVEHRGGGDPTFEKGAGMLDELAVKAGR